MKDLKTVSAYIKVIGGNHVTIIRREYTDGDVTIREVPTPESQIRPPRMSMLFSSDPLKEEYGTRGENKSYTGTGGKRDHVNKQWKFNL